MTWPTEKYETALLMVEWGLNDCQIGRVLGIPRGTIRDWRHGKRSTSTERSRVSDCPICSRISIRDRESYAYLLGLYLGDGCISAFPRAERLRIAMDQRYIGIIDECGLAMAAMRAPGVMKVGVQQLEGCVEIYSYWQHWSCLFPQHGPGVKHTRKIELVDWQKEVIKEHPGRFLRGLIHSDGWRGINKVKGYEYPRYQFTNYSKDIQRIFCWACDLYGVNWRQMKWNVISIARRSDVAKLDQVVGPKQWASGMLF